MSITCSVHIILFTCVISGLVAWHLMFDWCCLPWGKLSPHSIFLSGYKVEAYSAFLIHFSAAIRRVARTISEAHNSKYQEISLYGPLYCTQGYHSPLLCRSISLPHRKWPSIPLYKWIQTKVCPIFHSLPIITYFFLLSKIGSHVPIINYVFYLKSTLFNLF